MFATLGCATPDETASGGDSAAVASGGTFGGVAFQPSAVNFGTVTLQMTATAAIVLANTSNSEVKISNAFTDGAGFELETELTLPQTLAPDDAITVEVGFNPDATGEYEGVLNIGVAGEVGYGEVALRGSVRDDTTADDDAPAGDGILSVSPEALAFGEAGLTDVVWRSVELGNVGTAPFLIRSITSSSPTVFQTEPDFGLPKLMAPESTVYLMVGFSPSEMRDYAAVIDIETDTDDGGALIPVSGTGSDSGCTVCAPIMTVSTSSGGNERLVLAPPSGVGCTANGGVTIGNAGDRALDVTSLELVNDLISTCGTFRASWPGTMTIEPGNSAVVGVDYVATESCTDAPYEDFGHNVLTIQGTDPANPIHTVALEANALFCG